MSSRDLFSRHLVEALPYIRKFYGKVIVIKYGGAAMIDETLKQEFCRDIVLLDYVGVKPVVVHGGGPQVTRLMGRLGMSAEFVDGMRVTDKETIDIVEMVLSGGVGKEIVARINLEGGKAVGLSGKDANLIRARKLMHSRRDDPGGKIDIGFVGEIVSINAQVLESLESGGLVPVISPLGVGEDGQAYNINADIVAGEIAYALEAERLILLTDTPGVLRDRKDPESLITSLRATEARDLIDSGRAEGGMIPKLQSCLRALGGGVRKAHIIDGRTPHSVLLELFTDTGIGTQVYHDL